MANRAYLYVSDGEGEWNFRLIEGPPEAWYYASRWNLPPAWLFFFAPEDMRLVPVKEWHEILFVSPRLVAVDRFRRREPLLRTLLPSLVGWQWVEGFIRDIAQTEGGNLILDPTEVLSEDEPVIAPRFQVFLAELDHPPATPEVVKFWQSLYWATEDVREMRLRILGCTFRQDGRDYGFPDGYPTDS